MRQQYRLLGLEQPRVDRRLMLEDIESGAAQFACLQHAGQGVLVDHLAARGVHDDGFLLHQFQAPRREQVIGGRVCGQLTETMSMRASIWSRLSQ